jgi:hypothetical protein
MSISNSEILFNKKNLKTPIEQSASTAKGIIYLLEDMKVLENAEDSVELVNLYTKRVNKPSAALTKKMTSNEIRPFEFLINRN